MTTLPIINATDLHKKLQNNAVQLIDIRESREFNHEHVEGAVSVPLSTFGNNETIPESDKQTVFMCLSGMRTSSNAGKLADCISGDSYILDGGLNSWKRAGHDVKKKARTPFEINRQIQIAGVILILIAFYLQF
jgi:rhodanese-related sulfurtransferase